MKKMCKALALTLCMIMLLSTLTVTGDSGGKTILTLEEAKEIAIKSNTRYKVQDSYIEQKKEVYNDTRDKYSHITRGKGSSIAEKSQYQIDIKLALENAYSAWQKEIFLKNDIKRESDYDVTIAYYDVMKAKNALDDAKRAMELAKKDLDIKSIEFEYDIATKTDLILFESKYKTSQIAYDKASSDYKNYLDALSKCIGQALDILTDDVDMAISTPDISTLDLDKIKEDYIKYSPAFYDLRYAVDLADYKKFLTDERYEYYDDELPRMSDTVEEQFADMIYKANRDYDNAKYQYDEQVKALNISLNSQYINIISTSETIENLKKTIANTRTTFSHNKLKYEFGLLAKIDFEKSESELKSLENKLSTTIITLNTQYVTLTQYSHTTEE